MTTCVIASGNWDPLHAGHLAYLKASRSLGDMLIVIVNNDHQVRLKKGKPFMPQADRLAIVQALACVSVALLSADVDRSVCSTLEIVYQAAQLYWKQRGGDLPMPVIFANGGDVAAGGCREHEVCERLGIVEAFGVGGTEKLCSSSQLIANARA